MITVVISVSNNFTMVFLLLHKTVSIIIRIIDITSNSEIVK